MNDEGLTRLIFDNKNKNKSDKDNFSPNALFHETNGNKDNLVNNVLEKEKKTAFDQGYKEGLANAQAKWNTQLSFIKNLAEAIEHPLNDMDQIIQEKTTELAISVAKQVIRRELTLDSGQIVSVVKQAVELIPKDAQELKIYINPGDDRYVKESFSNEEKLSKYSIIHDSTISLGGCKVCTDYSLVDLTIDKQVATIFAQVFGDQRNANR